MLLALRLFHLGCFLFEAGEEAVEAGVGLAGLLAEAFAEAAAEVVGHPVERVMNLGINKEILSTKIF